MALIVICLAAAALGGAVTTAKVGTWYVGIAKPAWTPPAWLFGPVWTVLYLSMACAAWIVWKQYGAARAAIPLTLFGIQLVLNIAWSWIFFGLESPGLACGELVLLWLAIVATLAAFWRRALVAGLLFVPYLAWVSFAGLLNFVVWRLNV